MIQIHRSDSIILFLDGRSPATITLVHAPRLRFQRFTMYDDREHVISVVLTHEDWQEFVRLQPQPVNWLREKIQETIEAARHESGKTSAPAQVAC
jgi:hypothetical protein